MIKLLLRIISRFRLNFMMGENLENIKRKMHGYNKITSKDSTDTIEIIEPLLHQHYECCILINDITLVLYHNKLVVYNWYESYG